MSPLGSVGAGTGTGFYAVNRQTSSEASQAIRRAEQAERQAGQLLQESRSARAEATRLQQVANERETQANGLQDDARKARSQAGRPLPAVQVDTFSLDNPLRERDAGGNRNPYANVRVSGQLLDTSA